MQTMPMSKMTELTKTAMTITTMLDAAEKKQYNNTTIQT